MKILANNNIINLKGNDAQCEISINMLKKNGIKVQIIKKRVEEKLIEETSAEKQNRSMKKARAAKKAKKLNAITIDNNRIADTASR